MKIAEILPFFALLRIKNYRSDYSLYANYKTIGYALTDFVIIVCLFLTIIETSFFWKNMFTIIKILNITVLVTGIYSITLKMRALLYPYRYFIFAFILMCNIYISGIINNWAGKRIIYDSNPYALICFILILICFFADKKQGLILTGLQISFFFTQHVLVACSIYETALCTSSLVLFAVAMYLVFDLLEKTLLQFDRSKQIIIEQKIDIETQSQKLKEQNFLLEELQAYKEEVAHMLVHDIKNGLNTIIQYSEEKINPVAIKQVHSTAAYLLNLTTNLLDVKRMEDRHLTLQKEEVSIIEVINQAIGQVESFAAFYNITIAFNTSTDYHIFADFSIIKRVVINLLDNAVKYSPLNESITVTLKNEDNNLMVSIADNGCGIGDQRQFLFEKYPGGMENNRVPVSTGLGLAFCKLAIETHEGRIWLNSQKGYGTIVTFMLPGVSVVKISPASTLQNSHLWQLTPEEKTALAPYISKLAELECYNASEIIRILKEIPSGYSPNIEIWKNKITNCIFTVNNKQYLALLNCSIIYDNLQPTGNIGS